MLSFIEQRALALSKGFHRGNPYKVKEIREEISSALREFYSDADKNEFLDHYVRFIEEEMDDHRPRCSGGPNCSYTNCYNASIFYVTQEREQIERNAQDRKLKNFGTFIGSLQMNGQGAVLNLGKVAGDINSNVQMLADQGNSDISEAIASLAKSVTEATEIKNEERLEYLEVLETLSSQALLSEQERMPKSALKNMIQFGLGALNALSSISTVVGATLPQIVQYFLV